MAYVYNANEKDATQITHKYNESLLEKRDPNQLKIENEDVENAKAHLILALGDNGICDDEGNIIYDSKKHPLLQFPTFPDTFNPFLWQINKDNQFAGKLKMTKGFCVATGIDIAAIGFIKSNTGCIILD